MTFFPKIKTKTIFCLRDASSQDHCLDDYISEVMRDDCLYRCADECHVPPVAAAGSNVTRQDAEITSSFVNEPRLYRLLQNNTHQSAPCPI